VHREFNMGLITGLSICAVIALVLVSRALGATQGPQQPRPTLTTAPALKRRTCRSTGPRRGVDGPSGTAHPTLGGRWLRD
jgi:hypothetical protein